MAEVIIFVCDKKKHKVHIFWQKIIEETITIAVQFNGKTRGNISILKDQNQTEVESIIQNDSKLNKYLKGAQKAY